MNQIKKVSKKIILAYCIPQFAVGLFTAMISNYLLYFYQPSKESGIPTLITQGVVVLGILTFIGFVKAVGHIIDAVTDPLVANLSDKSRNKKGRRIPFMKYAAIPFGLSALLIFCAPQNTPGLVNNIWVAVFIWAYFVFYTLYMIPHNALLPEMITDTKERVNVYTFNSLFFVTGSALGYVTPALVGMFKNAGLDVLLAWRATFAIFTVVGIILLLIPAVMIKEREYVNSVRPTVSLMQSLKHAFSNKHFRWVTLGQLLEGTAMSFFQSCIMYYVTSLMGLPETASVAILAISIVGSLCLYPLISKWGKKSGTAKRAAGKLLLGHHRIILIGASEGLVTDIALGFEGADHRRERIEMGFRLGGQRDQFPHEQRAVFPETAHQFLFPACQFFHSVGCF